jgi:hypothetical protein
MSRESPEWMGLCQNLDDATHAADPIAVFVVCHEAHETDAMDCLVVGWGVAPLGLERGWLSLDRLAKGGRPLE